jgi:hypothetical protein
MSGGRIAFSVVRGGVQLWILLFRQPERLVEIVVALPAPQQAFSLEPLEVWQVAQGDEAERLEEFPRRDIGERRAGLGSADGAVDEPMALERSDDVAADLAADQPGNLPPGDRLQISDRRQRKGLVRNRTLRSNGSRTHAARRSPAGRRSDLKPSGRCCSLSHV